MFNRDKYREEKWARKGEIQRREKENRSRAMIFLGNLFGSTPTIPHGAHRTDSYRPKQEHTRSPKERKMRRQRHAAMMIGKRHD